MEHIDKIIDIILFICFLALAGFLIFQVYHNGRLQDSLNKLMSSFDELDEQAKLIVKTDLELNKAQEELDKRLSGLDALQKISRLVSTTLDENGIFQQLKPELLKELGFEKYMVFILDPKNRLNSLINIGFSPETVTPFGEDLKNDETLNALLQEGQILSSLKNNAPASLNITKRLTVRHFVLAPIMSQKKLLGIIFAGNHSNAFAITQGDEELISIFADQMGQAVENARLFEQVYRSSQMLELKVSERTRELTSALEEVKKISKTKSEFISAVSHELRTPLTSIKGYASILITGKVGEIPDMVKERLEKINKHSDNLVKLINDLLDISRIESGRVDMKFIKHDLRSMIDGVEDLLTPQMKDKGIHITKDYPDVPFEVFADTSQMERVFINLIGNAIKFTPVNGTISVSMKQDGSKITVTVADTGIGIKENDIAKLFTEFYRVENEINQNIKGTGLGLALAKKIVEAHRGRIWVTSQVNQGAHFHVNLPTDPPPAPAVS